MSLDSDQTAFFTQHVKLRLQLWPVFCRFHTHSSVNDAQTCAGANVLSHYDPVNDNNGEQRPDRRANVRRRVLFTGKIVYPHNSFTADCTIRNLSSEGALIAIAPEAISSDPFLIVVKDAVVHESKAIWRSGMQAGLHFENTISLTGKTPVHLQHAQRIWAELMPR